MSCVRELKLVQKEKKYILKQLPVKEMECLRTNKHEMKNIKMGADEEWTLCDKKEVLELVQRIINNCYIKPMPLPLH